MISSSKGVFPRKKHDNPHIYNAEIIYSFFRSHKKIAHINKKNDFINFK